MVFSIVNTAPIVRGKSTACAGEGGWQTNKRVTTPRSLGGLGHLKCEETRSKQPPHLKNGGRGRAQWPGRKIPPANINPPYVWVDGKKHVSEGTFL